MCLSITAIYQIKDGGKEQSDGSSCKGLGSYSSSSPRRFVGRRKKNTTAST
jgi:hypothetical protein